MRSEQLYDRFDDVLEREGSVMNSRIRIIKHGALGKPNGSPVHHAEKTAQERERETASTVQGWVAEWKERKRSLQMATFALLRGLDQEALGGGWR